MKAPKKEAGGGKTVKVEMLSRVEGEGGLYVKLKGEKVQDVQFRIFEPPRLYEAFLRGRHYTEVPDITARICGICPIAYQMSACHALERALGIRIDPAVRMLRRLFYCGEWIESHALHIYMLHAPDFFGLPDVIHMVKDHRAVVEKALRLKKIGNSLVSFLGGREIHPVGAAVGGFHRVPTRRELRTLKEDLEWALEASLETVRFTAALEFPELEPDYEFVSLSHPDEYPFNEGRLVSSKGVDISTDEFDDVFAEQHIAYSNALFCYVRGRGSYMVGPLARFALNFDKLPAVAQEAARGAGLKTPCMNPFQSIVVRAVELVFACHEALRIIDAYEPPARPREVPAELTPGTGSAATEAPRGMLFHRYSVDADGLIREARIVPPTAQNQKRMEDDLWALVPKIIHQPQSEVTFRCEQAVRNYDPCISCATHFLQLKIDRE
jgi:coenzyme F420-reducing hydrogenase alpha subunit